MSYYDDSVQRATIEKKLKSSQIIELKYFFLKLSSKIHINYPQGVLNNVSGRFRFSGAYTSRRVRHFPLQ